MSTDELNSGWFVHSSISGREGPISLEVLREKLFNRAFSDQDWAWHPSLSGWKKISEIDLLKASIHADGQSETEIDPLRLRKGGPIRTNSMLSALPVELETQNSLRALRREPSASVSPSIQTPVSTGPDSLVGVSASVHGTAGTGNRFDYRLLLFASLAIIACFALSTIDFQSLRPSQIVAWLFGSHRFQKISDLSEQDNSLLFSAARANLEKSGPKIELVHTSTSETTSFYVATNLPDGASFELELKPLPETVVGEVTDLAPLRLQTEKHLAHAKIEQVLPGYYWAILLPAQHQSPSAASWIEKLPEAQTEIALNVQSRRHVVWTRKVFLGGVADVGYQTRLKDFTAVRRGMARAELERVHEAYTKMDALLNTEKQAALTLSNLKIEQARAQAWEIFQPTWNQAFAEIQNLLLKPTRFLGRAQKLAVEIEEPLKKLHNRHEGLVHPVVTSGSSKAHGSISSQLAPSSVARAGILADGQIMANEITVQLQTLKTQLDLASKRIDDTLTPLMDEPYAP